MMPGYAAVNQAGPVLQAESFKHYVDYFNETDDETVVNHIPNAQSWAWFEKNVPLFECPDKDIERTYYFRWWTYRKHIRKTPDGFVITEFLPSVSWAGPHNVIACPLGHQIYEGRWIRDHKYLDNYIRFWFSNRELSHVHGDFTPFRSHWVRYYSNWLADAAYQRYLVNGDREFILSILDDLVENDNLWEKEHLLENGLFWQSDGHDGMEWSIGGSGARPTLNSYMYGDALAISKIAELAGKTELATKYKAKAAKRRQLTLEKLWDDKDKFFKVRAYDGYRSSRDKLWPNDTLVDVREQLGYIPWYFNLPEKGYEAAWLQFADKAGFRAPYGITTAERRHPRFRKVVPLSDTNYAYDFGCQWNGPVWPYATSQTLVALANLLNNYQQNYVTSQDYFDALKTYVKSQHKEHRPWIGENLNEITGKWIVDQPRSKDYNHSTFCDLVITGLVGLRPRADDVIEINPLVPEGKWSYFCLDNVPYKGHTLTILFDAEGKEYQRGKGLHVFADGRRIAGSGELTHLKCKMPTEK